MLFIEEVLDLRETKEVALSMQNWGCIEWASIDIGIAGVDAKDLCEAELEDFTIEDSLELVTR